jgi:hypothetical protein
LEVIALGHLEFAGAPALKDVGEQWSDFETSSISRRRAA